MPMGVLAAPSWLKHVIKSLLDASEVDMASAFLDDIIVGGTAADWY